MFWNSHLVVYEKGRGLVARWVEVVWQHVHQTSGMRIVFPYLHRRGKPLLLLLLFLCKYLLGGVCCCCLHNVGDLSLSNSVNPKPLGHARFSISFKYYR